MKAKRTTIVLVGILTATSLGLVLSPPVQVCYHRWQYKRTQTVYSYDWRNGGPHEQVFGEYSRIAYHRERLVDLGHLFRTEYKSERIHRQPAALAHLIESYQRSGVGSDEACFFAQPKEGTIVVYEHESHRRAWTAFIEKYDPSTDIGWYLAELEPTG